MRSHAGEDASGKNHILHELEGFSTTTLSEARAESYRDQSVCQPAIVFRRASASGDPYP